MGNLICNPSTCHTAKVLYFCSTVKIRAIWNLIDEEYDQNINKPTVSIRVAVMQPNGEQANESHGNGKANDRVALHVRQRTDGR